ncbi:ACBP-domain-containing protein, partial [Atractiella rhizophila]
SRFESSVRIVQSLPKSGPIQTSYDDKLQLYSLYKQATEGPPTTPRPGVWDVLGRSKWDAWNRRRALSKTEAEKGYGDVLVSVRFLFLSYIDLGSETDRKVDRYWVTSKMRNRLRSGYASFRFPNMLNERKRKRRKAVLNRVPFSST